MHSRLAGFLRLTFIGFALATTSSATAQMDRSKLLPSKPPQDVKADCHLLLAERMAPLYAPEDLETLRADLDRRGIVMRKDACIHAQIVGTKGMKAISQAFLTAFGAQLENSWRHIADVWVPVDRISVLARTLPDGYRLLRQQYARPTRAPTHPAFRATGGEGALAIGSDTYRDAGFDGAGKKIAIIDLGFWKLTQAIANGDAPSSSLNLNYTSSEFEASGEEHGTACTEAAFDHCPGASFVLCKVSTVADFGNAIDDCMAQDVDIISISLGWNNMGWNDDDGAPCDAVNDAANNGILVFVSAGNEADRHWQGMYEPDSEPEWHDFSPGDISNNITVEDSESVTVYMDWDPSGGLYDYDLMLWDPVTGEAVATSNNPVGFDDVVVWFNATGANRTLHIRVHRDSGSETEFELYIFDGDDDIAPEYVTASSSVSTPGNATAPNVITVGAVDWDDYASSTAAITSYSSQGPSNDGMLLPDIVAPTGTNTTAYGGEFNGTSCSTPNAAGAACAFWSAHSNFTSSAIRFLIHAQASAFKDWGETNADNVFGRGGFALEPYAPGTRWLARDYGNLLNLPTGPYFTFQTAAENVPDGGRLLAIPGGNYPEPGIVTGTAGFLIRTIQTNTNLGFSE